MAVGKSEKIVLETERLRLRQWKLADYKPFSELNADPEVMRYFPRPLVEQESDLLARRIEASIARQGWGFWAVERRKDGRFIGVVGLSEVEDLPFSPCVEIGWRLARPYWGQGYASEAARAALHFAFATLGLEEVVAFTPVGNRASRGLMEKLHMRDSRLNFLHPDVPAGHPLAEHVLYRITHEQWQRSGASRWPAPRQLDFLRLIDS